MSLCCFGLDPAALCDHFDVDALWLMTVGSRGHCARFPLRLCHRTDSVKIGNEVMGDVMTIYNMD